MELNSSMRTLGAEGGPLLVELDVPSAGLLSVGVVAPIAVEAESGVVVRLACLPRSAPEPVVLKRSVGHQVLAVDAAGPYVFRVESQDPRRVLAELKLSSAFVPEAGAGGVSTHGVEDEDEIEINGLWTPPADVEDEDEIEINGLWTPPADVEDEDEIEINGLWTPPADVEDEDEIEINGFAAPARSRSLISLLDQLCRQGEVDDHGDSFNCATFLVPGRAVSGEIGNGWRDDADTFHFVIGDALGADPWTVTIETSGDLDTVGELYDLDGQRLDIAEGGGRGDNFRIVRSLRPGAYFVRIEGREGTEGSYSLSVTSH